MPLKSFILHSYYFNYNIKPQNVIYGFYLMPYFLFIFSKTIWITVLVDSLNWFHLLFFLFLFNLTHLFSSLMITNDMTFTSLYLGTKKNTLIRFQICDMENNRTEKDWYHVNKLNTKLIRAHFNFKTWLKHFLINFYPFYLLLRFYRKIIVDLELLTTTFECYNMVCKCVIRGIVSKFN